MWDCSLDLRGDLEDVGLFWRYRALLRPWVSFGRDAGLLGDAGQGTTARGTAWRED